jgi:hypothetical protein
MNGELKSNLEGLVLHKDANLKLLRRDLLRFFGKHLSWLDMKESISFEALDGEGHGHKYVILPVEKKKFESALMSYYMLRRKGVRLSGPIDWAFLPHEDLPIIGFELASSDVIVTDDLMYQSEYRTAAAKLYAVLKNYTRVKTTEDKARSAETLQNSDVALAILSVLEEHRLETENAGQKDLTKFNGSRDEDSD